MARASSGVPTIHDGRRASSQAAPTSANPNCSRRTPERRSTSAASRPTSTPTIAEWTSVDGSRPAALAVSSSFAKRSATRSGVELVTLNSSA
jgi:hypothetical protein